MYLLGHDVGVAGNPEVQVIGEQSVELHAQQTALGQHAAPLLHHKAEVPLQRIVHNDHGFAEQSAHLVAADVEHIAQPRQLRQGQVAIVAGEAVAHPRTVDKEGQAALPAHLVQRRQLRLGVHGAALGGEGDIHHAGHDHVLIVGAEVMPIVIVLHLLGGDLAVVGGQGQHLVAGGLDGAGLVAVDVAAGGGEDALIGPQNGGDHRGVGQRTAHQEVNVGVRGLAGCLDLFPCGGAVLILAVAHGLDHVGLVELCHQGGVCALQIIAVEVDHLILLLFPGGGTCGDAAPSYHV